MAHAAGDAHDIAVYGAHCLLTFPILDADGDLVTGATGLDSEVSKDLGGMADCTNEATEIATSSGVYYLYLTGAEMTANMITVIVKTTSSGAKTTVLTLYPKRLPVFESGTAQAGATTTITLASGASAVDNFYNGMFVYISNNGAAGSQYQLRKIISYVGSTRVATVESAWGTNPSASSTYDILMPETARPAGNATLSLINNAGTTTLTGNVSMAAGLTITQSQSNSHGLSVSGNGTGSGISATGGASGNGIKVLGGSSSGNGIAVVSVSGHAVSVQAGGASAHGISVTGGDSGTSDGIKFTAGTGGVGVRYDTLSASGLTTLTGLTTGALSCTTITASGAVAFQSTFAVTTSTSLAALSCTTLATSGTATLNALTITNNLLVSGNSTVTGTTVHTGNVSMAAGLTVTQSSANASALVVTGNGTGSGAVFTSGSGATGDGVRMLSASTNGDGLYLLGTGTGSGFETDDITVSANVEIAGTVTIGLLDVTTDVTFGTFTVNGDTTLVGSVIASDLSNNIVGVDVSKVGGTAQTAGDIVNLISDLQSRIPAILVGGRMDSSIGEMSANVLTASALATDAVEEIRDSIGADEGDTGVSLDKIKEMVAAFFAGKVSVSSSGGISTYTYKRRDGTTTSFTSLCSEADGTRATTGSLS